MSPLRLGSAWAPVQLSSGQHCYKLPLHLQNALGRRICVREKVWGMHAHGLMSACVNACVCLCTHVSVHGRDVVGLSQSPEGRRRTNAP